MALEPGGIIAWLMLFSFLLPGSSAGLIGSIVVAFIGAVILIWLVRALSGGRAAV